jgi:hypothetical protein
MDWLPTDLSYGTKLGRGGFAPDYCPHSFAAQNSSMGASSLIICSANIKLPGLAKKEEEAGCFFLFLIKRYSVPVTLYLLYWMYQY